MSAFLLVFAVLVGPQILQEVRAGPLAFNDGSAMSLGPGLADADSISKAPSDLEFVARHITPRLLKQPCCC